MSFSRQLRIPSSKFSKGGESTILYELNAVVVHCGKEINRGHYITLVRAHPQHDKWLCFDDEEGKLKKLNFQKNNKKNIQKKFFFGISKMSKK